MKEEQLTIYNSEFYSLPRLFLQVLLGTDLVTYLLSLIFLIHRVGIVISSSAAWYNKAKCTQSAENHCKKGVANKIAWLAHAVIQDRKAE